MTEETEAPQGLPEGEPVAALDPNPSDPSPENPAPDPAAAPPAPSEETDADKLRKALQTKDALEKRIHRQNAKIADYHRREEAMRAAPPLRTDPNPPRDPNAPPARPPAPAPQGQDAIERRAAEIVQQREHQARLQQWDAKGRAEFPDFVDRCNTVASFLDDPASSPFVNIVSDMDDGHKVVAYLADNPDDASRILSLPDRRMAIELGKLSAKGFAPRPPPQSAAPPPIKPLNGSGRVETDPDKMSTAEWMKWREKQLAP